MQKSIRCLLVQELQDLLSAEHQIVKAMPIMIEAAESQELKNALSGHLSETRQHVKRLEKIFRLMRLNKNPKFCSAVSSLIKAGHHVLGEFRRKSALRDAAIISKAQMIEHYEICAYGTARTIAKELGLTQVARLLQETLDEEGGANAALNRIAKGWIIASGVNHEAHMESDHDEDDHLKSHFFKALRRFQKARKAA